MYALNTPKWAAKTVAALMLVATALLAGCGGAPNDGTVISGNTVLTISPSAIPTITVGTARTISVSVIDPDGIDSVRAILDGAPIDVAVNTGANGSTYAVTLPATLAIGPHTIEVTGRGKAPDGTLEVPRSLSFNFTVFAVNTALTLSPIAGLPSFNAGTTQTYSTTVIDPNGTTNVTATLDGAPLATTNAGGVYSVVLPSSLATGLRTIVFTAVGRNPDGSNEPAIQTSVKVSINTPLTITPVSGISMYTVGASQVLSARITDPNGIGNVTARLDGVEIASTNSGGTYSVALPSNLAVGPHTLTFSATGLNADATAEPVQTVVQSITVFPVNTPLVISSVTGPASYSFGPAQGYSVQVVDADMVAEVTATLDGAPIGLTVSGNAYSLTVPANTPLGNHVLVFTATGKRPDGTLESPQSVSLNFAVIQLNSPLSVGGLSSVFDKAQNIYTYSIVATDGDGISGVIATVQSLFPVTAGLLPPPQSFTPTVQGSTYSIALPEFSCRRRIVFTVTGRLPNGSPEGPVTRSLDEDFCGTVSLGAGPG